MRPEADFLRVFSPGNCIGMIRIVAFEPMERVDIRSAARAGLDPDRPGPSEEADVAGLRNSVAGRADTTSLN
jgi:hypothetical protein